MEEEGGNGLKIIIGIVVVIVLLVGGFFLLRGLLGRKTLPNTPANAFVPTTIATPTSAQLTPTPIKSGPTSRPTPQTKITKTTKGSTIIYTNGTVVFPTYTSSQSQSQSSTNSSMSQSQSQ